MQAHFRSIDKDGNNYIDSENLKSFLIRRSFIPNDNLIMAVIRRLDIDCDAKLNLGEFIDTVRPLENYRAKMSEKKNSSFRRPNRDASADIVMNPFATGSDRPQTASTVIAKGPIEAPNDSAYGGLGTFLRTKSAAKATPTK